MVDKNIRWKQRFENFKKALLKLSDAIENEHQPTDIVKEGIIQRFEFTHELAWKVMKDFLEYEGEQNITGSRSATRSFFNKNLIKNGQEWMNMIESRNKTIHTYQQEILNEEFNKIITIYYPLFKQFKSKMETL